MWLACTGRTTEVATDGEINGRAVVIDMHEIGESLVQLEQSTIRTNCTAVSQGTGQKIVKTIQ